MGVTGDSGTQAILQHLAEQDEVLVDIRSEARKTNGRVTALELDKVRRDERASVLAEVASLSDGRRVRKQDRWQWQIGTLVALCAASAAVASAMFALLH